jgi:hypothetical protein
MWPPSSGSKNKLVSCLAYSLTQKIGVVIMKEIGIKMLFQMWCSSRPEVSVCGKQGFLWCGSVHIHIQPLSSRNRGFKSPVSMALVAWFWLGSSVIYIVNCNARPIGTSCIPTLSWDIRIIKIKGSYRSFLCTLCLMREFLYHSWISFVFFAGVFPDCERYNKMYVKQNTNKFLYEMGEGW